MSKTIDTGASSWLFYFCILKLFIVTGPKFYIVYILNESFWKFSLVPLQSMCYRVVVL